MIEKLLLQYRKSLPEKSETLRKLGRALQRGDPSAKDQIFALAHTLHGSGATYGMPEISTSAKLVEQGEEAALADNLNKLIETLDRCAEVSANSDSMDAGHQITKNKVLLIDDDTDISNLLKFSVEKISEHIAVTTAISGSAARAVLQEQSFDLILVDLILPDTDGRNLIEEIRASSASAKAFILVLSGVDSEEIRTECLHLGANDYIAKPFSPEQIAQQVKKVLETGTVDVKETVSRGDTTKITPAKNATPHSPLSILLAEDDELLAKVILHRLGKAGFNVSHVLSGDKAVEQLLATKYDLAILDVKMPELDGLEVLAKIRSELDDDLPVIILSAMGSEKDIVRGYELGASDYMLKPFSPVELVARVKNLIR